MPEAVVEEITGKVLAQLPGKPAPKRERRQSKHPFGIKGFDVAKFLISMAMAVIVAYFGMKFAIEKNTAAIEQNSSDIEKAHEMVHSHETETLEHEKVDHKELDSRVQKVERTTDRIEIMQTQTLEAIKDLKADLRDSRRRDRRER